MTNCTAQHEAAIIIPYQELLGNYDSITLPFPLVTIIPYQELLGNYDGRINDISRLMIIPYQELLGNYDLWLGGKRL